MQSTNDSGTCIKQAVTNDNGKSHHATGWEFPTDLGHCEELGNEFHADDELLVQLEGLLALLPAHREVLG